MTTKVDFSGVKWGSVEWTMLCTLYLRACESRSGSSILGDHAAAEAVERIDYDFDRIKRRTNPSSNQYLVALRAAQFDRWTNDFLTRHPDATVLHLGCGLDSRAFRLSVPASVRWYDVDAPQVIALRRQVYQERDDYRMIGSSVTESAWLDEIPAGGPVLVVAEGLLPYLTADDVRGLLRRITERFGGGEVLFDGVPKWIVRVTGFQHWGIRSEREIDQWGLRLRLVEKTSAGADCERIPVRRTRLLFRAVNVIPGLRSFSRLFRFEITGPSVKGPDGQS